MKMSMKTFESEENQARLRQLLLSYAYKNKVSILEMGKLLDLGAFTVNRFLKEERDVDFKTLCKIDEFLECVLHKKVKDE